MGLIRDEEIRGYRLGGRVICLDCVETDEDDIREIKEQNIITNEELEHLSYEGCTLYCDRCGEEL